MFSVSENIFAIIFRQVNAIPPFIIFDPRRLTSWCCQLFSSGQRTYKTSPISSVCSFEGVLKCRFEVSSFGGWYFVLCQELEHLNVTWVSERDVPETVEMWNYRKLSSVHLPWLILLCSTLSIQSDMWMHLNTKATSRLILDAQSLGCLIWLSNEVAAHHFLGYLPPTQLLPVELRLGLIPWGHVLLERTHLAQDSGGLENVNPFSCPWSVDPWKFSKGFCLGVLGPLFFRGNLSVFGYKKKPTDFLNWTFFKSEPEH